MSDPAHPAPATPEKKGKLGMLWGILALLVVTSYTGALSGFGREIANFLNPIWNSLGNGFMTMKIFLAPILLLMAAFFFWRKKKADASTPPAGTPHP